MFGLINLTTIEAGKVILTLLLFNYRVDLQSRICLKISMKILVTIEIRSLLQNSIYRINKIIALWNYILSLSFSSLLNPYKYSELMH